MAANGRNNHKTCDKAPCSANPIMTTNGKNNPKTCDISPCSTKANKNKPNPTNLPPVRTFDHDIFHCPCMQKAERDKVQYLYADPYFIVQATTPREVVGDNDHAEDEQFYDCQCDSMEEKQQRSWHEKDQHQMDQQQQPCECNIADIIDSIKDPKEFKALLKEVAYTSHILYRCFRKAYHRVKKTTLSPENSRNKPTTKRKCEKCAQQRAHERKQQKMSKNNEETEKVVEEQNKKNRLEGCKPSDAIAMERHDDDNCHCSQDDQGDDDDNKKQKNKVCGNTEGSTVLLNGFRVHKICPSADPEFEGLSFCDYCAKLRGEPIEVEKEKTPKIEDEKGGAVQSKINVIYKPMIIRCPDRHSYIAKEVPNGKELGYSMDKPSSAAVTNPEQSTVASEILQSDGAINNLSTEKQINEAPTANDMSRAKAGMSEELAVENQSATTAEHVDDTSRPCPLSHNKTNAPSPALLQSTTTAEEFKAISSKCACSQSRYVPTEKTTPARSPPAHPCPCDSRTHESLSKVVTNSAHHKSCPCSKIQRSPLYPIGSKTLLKSQRHKHSRKANMIQMHPISFALPINLQIQTPNGETHLVQNKVVMEATLEPGRRKCKTKSYATEPIRTATIAATHVPTTKDNATQSVEQLHQYAVAAIGDQTESHDTFYSCASCSTIAPVSSRTDKPCESLLEIFEIVKTRVANNNSVPSQLIENMVGYNFKECLTNTKLLPQAPEVKDQSTSADKATQPIASTSQVSSQQQLKSFGSLQTQTEALTMEQSPVMVDKQTSNTASLTMQPLEGPQLDVNGATTKPLLYHQGSGCFDLPLTNRRPEAKQPQPTEDLLQDVINDLEQKTKMLETQDLIDSKGALIEDRQSESIAQQYSIDIISGPVSPPTAPESPQLVSKVSAMAQTDILSSNAYAHFKRNEIRKEIVEYLQELLRPGSSLTTYEATEREQILSTLHQLFTPKRAGGQIPKDESRQSVLDDIRLLLRPREMHKTTSSPAFGATELKSRTLPKKSASTEIVIKDIKHVLNPKVSEKPSKRFSKDHRSNVLETLHNLLSPSNQLRFDPSKTRDMVLDELRSLLDTETIQNFSLPSAVTTTKPKFKIPEIVKSSSEDLNKSGNNGQTSTKAKKVAIPSTVKANQQAQRQHSSSEDLSTADERQGQQSRRQAPPIPKKPKRKLPTKTDEGKQPKTQEVDYSELIPSSQDRYQTPRIGATHTDEGLSLVSTSTDTFFMNIGEDQEEVLPRPSSFLRRSQYFSASDTDDLLHVPELRDDKDFKEFWLHRKLKKLEQETGEHQEDKENTADQRSVNVKSSKMAVSEEPSTSQHNKHLPSRLESGGIASKNNDSYIKDGHHRRPMSQRNFVTIGNTRGLVTKTDEMCIVVNSGGKSKLIDNKENRPCDDSVRPVFDGQSTILIARPKRH